MAETVTVPITINPLLNVPAPVSALVTTTFQVPVVAEVIGLAAFTILVEEQRPIPFSAQAVDDELDETGGQQ